jgi:hypothetical protein
MSRRWPKHCEICLAASSNQANRALGGHGSPTLHKHHIYPRRLYPELSHKGEFKVKVCQECHVNVEGKLGTRQQVINWGRAIILRQILKSLQDDKQPR